jgi:hypothetical protein
MVSISSPSLGVLPVQSNRWLIIIHAATIFLSALLLFQVQPIISRFILPWFGGTPAVWTTAMLFFQTLLLAGYAYAHLSVQYFQPVWQLAVHLALLAGAVIALPFVPNADWKPADGSHPIARILLLLTVCVGVPYFVLSTTGPLVQAWFNRANPGRSPYRLYSLSNIGSLLALLTYPFLIEPHLALGAQAIIWQWAFWLFAGLCALGAITSFRGSASERTASEALPRSHGSGSARRDDTGSGASKAVRSQAAFDSEAQARREPGNETPNWPRRLVWLILPALASTALLATTNHACQDVAVVPFLWIAPLSLYLLSFIVCFDHERWYWPRGTAAITLLVYACGGILMLLIAFEKANALSTSVKKADIALSFGGLFCLAMLCHGEVVRLKPHPRHLTSFYLMIAAGGALGGLFVGVLSPIVFSGYAEWHIAILCGLLLAIAILLGTGENGLMRRHVRRLVPAMIVVAGMLVVAGNAWLTNPRALDAQRDFYGVLTVVEDPKDGIRTLLNGRITHGRQYMDKQRRELPTTYYARESGIGRAIDFFAADGLATVRVGAIGLGTGTLAAYARANDEFVFYEINPEVPKISREYFSYLDDALDRMKQGNGHLDIVMGDARLSLEQQPSRREKGRGFQVIAVDAFSGDAIPIHLITRQAGDIYLRQLDPNGVLAIHISNRYLNLAPVVRGLADYLKLKALRIDSDSDADRDIYGASWMLLTNNEKLLATLAPLATTDNAAPSLLWTDDFSNLFEILK